MIVKFSKKTLAMLNKKKSKKSLEKAWLNSEAKHFNSLNVIEIK